MFTSALRKNKKRKDVSKSLRRKYDDDSSSNESVNGTSTRISGDGDGDGDGSGDDSKERRRKEHKKKVKKKKKSKIQLSKNGGAMSFSLDGDDDNDKDNDQDEIESRQLGKRKKKDGSKSKLNSSSKSKIPKEKKKKRKLMSSRKTSGGLGFGGGMIPSHLNGEDDDDQDDSYSQPTISKAGIKRKHFGMGSMHSVIHDDDDDDDGDGDDKDNGSNRNRNRMMHTDNIEEAPPTEADAEEGAASIQTNKSLYGKEALQKLKAEQKSYTNKIISDKSNSEAQSSPRLHNTIPIAAAATTASSNNQNATSNNIKSNNIPLPPKPSSMKMPKPPTLHEDEDEDDGYIALDSSTTKSNRANMNIITGDEAMMYTGELQDDDIHTINICNNNTNNKEKVINKANLGTETLSNISKDGGSVLHCQVLMGLNDDNDHDKNNNNTNNVDDDDEVDDGGRQWEEEIARRAGVSVKHESTTKHHVGAFDSHGHHRDHQDQQKSSVETNPTIVSNVKKTIQTTIENLNQMDLDLESNIGRRGHDEDISKEDMNKKEMELNDIGDKFEYYQNLRVEMSNWISALRYVAERVDIVEKTMKDLYRDIAMKEEKDWREWEDDVISTLAEMDYIDYIVGRQPRIEQRKDEILVDEFGRDKRSSESLTRTRRKEQRRRIRRESMDRRTNHVREVEENRIDAVQFEDSDLDVSDHEIMDRDERRSALSDAISLVLDEMVEEYSTPLKLMSAFNNWQTHHGADYDQCYAKLALVDLMNIFARSECCQKLDLLCYTNKKKGCVDISLQDFSWSTAVEESKLHTKDDNSCVKDLKKEAEIGPSLNMKSQIISQGLCEHFFSVLQCQKTELGIYNPFSTKQTDSMVCFCKLILSNLSINNSKLRDEISCNVVQHINNFIQNLAIPVLNENISKVSKGDDDFIDECIIFSTLGQLYRLRKLVCNLTKWYPFLIGDSPSRLAKLCLMDIIAYRFLPILGIAERAPIGNMGGEVVSLFQDVWCCIKDIGWLDNSELILPSAPLRVAAKTHNLK